MADRLTPEKRHANMAAIHGRNTGPEMIVRRYLWGQGFRYLHNASRLPGHPDIVLRKYRMCIFIHGCFWHGHEGCRYYREPKTNTEFWREKVRRNQERDQRVKQALRAMGWRCMTIWECELKPDRRQQTLESLAYTLSRLYLDDRGALPTDDGRQNDGRKEEV